MNPTFTQNPTFVHHLLSVRIAGACISPGMWSSYTVVCIGTVLPLAVCFSAVMIAVCGSFVFLCSHFTTGLSF